MGKDHTLNCKTCNLVKQMTALNDKILPKNYILQYAHVNSYNVAQL